MNSMARGEKKRSGRWRGMAAGASLVRRSREAIDLLKRNFGGAEQSFHHRYASLIGEIERRFPVAQWRMGDVPVWPLARCNLYVDMHAPPSAVLSVTAGVAAQDLRRAGAAADQPLARAPRFRASIARACARDVVLLGDGVSLDRVDGAYQDRFGEPLIDRWNAKARRCS